jgi:hypothetical protein
VAFLKDPKQKRQNVFGLFSPSRNYHLEAGSSKDAIEWVNLIRQEARIEEEEEEMMLASPGGTAPIFHSGFERSIFPATEQRLHEERLGSSSPEPSDTMPWPTQNQGFGTSAPRRTSHTFDYSGNELASHSDMSDMELPKKTVFKAAAPEEPLAVQPPEARPMMEARNASQLSGFNAEDPERVIWHGYLLLLKSTGGMKQWKELWVVLRLRSLSLYKSDAEYSPLLIIPLPSIINAVEIDPLSKTKRHCLQVITEEKSYKFCAKNEDTLDKSLGALKSLLAKRKDYELHKKPAN